MVDRDSKAAAVRRLESDCRLNTADVLNMNVPDVGVATEVGGKHRQARRVELGDKRVPPRRIEKRLKRTVRDRELRARRRAGDIDVPIAIYGDGVGR